MTEGAPEKAMDIIFAADDTLVGCINGNPECSVLAQSGTMRLDETDLPLCVIAAITVEARVLCKKDTAVITLGMFDQGFYNKVGFGTGD